MRLLSGLTLLGALALAGCRKGGAPGSGLELVYAGAGLTEADAAIVNKRLGALQARGGASFEAGKLHVRVDPSSVEAVKRNLAASGKLEFFGVDDSTSKRLCGAPHPDGVTQQQESLRDGSITCFFTGEASGVRAAAEPVLGPKLRLQTLSGGAVRTFAVYPPAFLTGAAVVEAKVTMNPMPGVALTFDGPGAQLLAEHTEKLTDLRMAIVFDDRVQSAPTVMGTITGGHAVITTPQADEATQLAAVLSSGALPPLQLQSEAAY